MSISLIDFTDGRHRRGPLDAGHRLSRSDVSFRSVVNVGVVVDGEETSLDSEDDDADQRAAAVAEQGE